MPKRSPKSAVLTKKMENNINVILIFIITCRIRGGSMVRVLDPNREVQDSNLHGGGRLRGISVPRSGLPRGATCLYHVAFKKN
jgi:hypothetical protein